LDSATIKLFLPHGDANRLRTAEILNWTGKALAAPRTDLEILLEREELDKAGVYLLLGTDPDTGKPAAYIGEAEVIRDRLRQHKDKEFWVSVVTFVSKDENLTKSHIRYLEAKLIREASETGRFGIENSQAGGSKLPESDRADMEVFLQRIRQLLPVLGSDILLPIGRQAGELQPRQLLTCEIKNAVGSGHRTVNGFVVLRGSTAVSQERPSAQKMHPYVVSLRGRLREEGILKEENGLLVFTRDAEFTSPSAAASVIHGGGANGLTSWKDDNGRTLKELEA
jgi:hypothetical protein